jgi:hypothetical protein
MKSKSDAFLSLNTASVGYSAAFEFGFFQKNWTPQYKRRFPLKMSEKRRLY